MATTYIAWAASALVILVLAAVLGRAVVPPRFPLGILVDSRGRFSLTHFQLVTWSIVILSLISGVFWGRLLDGVDDPLDFSIPDEVLGLMGITIGSGLGATTVKSVKDATAEERIAISDSDAPSRIVQLFLLEEGSHADRVIDVTKFQNFVLTLVLVVAYVALSAQAIDDAGTAEQLNSLPGFSGTFLTLLGISHAAHVLGKIPPQAGVPPGPTVKTRRLASAA